MWIIGQKIFSDKNILPIKTANIFGKQYFTNKHVLAGIVPATCILVSLYVMPVIQVLGYAFARSRNTAVQIF